MYKLYLARYQCIVLLVVIFCVSAPMNVNAYKLVHRSKVSVVKRKKVVNKKKVPIRSRLRASEKNSKQFRQKNKMGIMPIEWWLVCIAALLLLVGVILGAVFSIPLLWIICLIILGSAVLFVGGYVILANTGFYIGL